MAAGPKFLAALVVNNAARTTTHTARAVSSSNAAIFSPPLAEPSHPRATECASAQNGWACVRKAYRPVISGAHHRSVVVHPYGRNSVGVVRVSAYGWKKEKRFVMKNPPLAVTCIDVIYISIACVNTIIRHTSEVRRRVQGLALIVGDVCCVTMGGIRLHKRYTRLKLSHTARGNSSSKDGTGTQGSFSTPAWIAV